jgi:3-deoxy-manno-octulosonate cytidylyltransferase (CMP-KDO synthetase)
MGAFTVIIPARHASTRLPGKMLADLGGAPMVVRVAQRAVTSGASRVVIATDHTDILQAATRHGLHAVMTSPDHPSGTDRLAQVCGLLDLRDDEIVVNVQGDEPLIDPTLIDSVASVLAADTEAAIATCAAPILSAQAMFNPNVVKVVCNRAGRALYFSRAPIPWDRDALAAGVQVLTPGLAALHHIGMYAYRVAFLRRFPTLERGALEVIESLEQLRALEHGYTIAVKTIEAHPGAGVDTIEDLARVRAAFESGRASG